MKFEFKKGSLILLSGIPGSGKSTFAQKFFPKHYILSSDELRERYFGSEYKFFEDGLVIKGNFESNSDLIFEILKKLLVARAQEGLTTVVDAMNLNDKVRNSFIQLYPRERIYTIIFDDKKAFEFNEIRKQKQTKGYIDPKILEKKQLVFEKFTKIKNNNIVFADQINEVEEKFEKLELTPHNNILIWGDIHGSPAFYQAYKDLNKKYTKNGNPPLNLFVGDIVDRGPMSIDNLCFVISEVKKNNARMIIGNHEVKLLKNIDAFLQTGIIFKNKFQPDIKP